MEEQIELFRSHHQLLEKYVFYIIALCVSAIGFSVYCTMGKQLQYSQILLLIAVLLWGSSIYFGLNHIKNLLDSKDIHYQIHTLKEISLSKEKYEAKNTKLLNDNIRLNSILVKYFRLQEYLFYAGVVLFIAWHIVQMYLTTC